MGGWGGDEGSVHGPAERSGTGRGGGPGVGGGGQPLSSFLVSGSGRDGTNCDHQLLASAECFC